MLLKSLLGAPSVVYVCHGRVWPFLWYGALSEATDLGNGSNLSTERHLFCFLSSTKHADSIDLELEVDPLNVDHFSCTPLVSSRN